MLLELAGPLVEIGLRGIQFPKNRPLVACAVNANAELELGSGAARAKKAADGPVRLLKVPEPALPSVDHSRLPVKDLTARPA